jgi:molybdate transport system regulatory protein
MTRLTIRVDFDSGAAFGPGKAKLLETVAGAKSIRAAAAMLGMSYRRAWMLLQEIETMVGTPVIDTATGGAKGGGSSLTTVGLELIDAYRALERRASKAAAAEIRLLERLARHKAGKRRPLSRGAKK